MSQELSIGKLGAIAPFKAKEGTITMTKDSSAHGSRIAPVHSAKLEQGTPVKLAGEMLVEKATGSDAIIGVVYNKEGKWVNGEPRQDYTQAAALSADMVREFAIETIFKKIETVDAKASEGITAGKYLVWKAAGVELSSSSGSTETKFLALSAQDSNNRVVVGFL
jgi:hypothetical protein